MSPDHARALYAALREHGEYPGLDDILDALNTIAHMRVEQKWRLADTDTNGGAYQVTRHTRHVTQWEEALSLSASPPKNPSPGQDKQKPPLMGMASHPGR